MLGSTLRGTHDPSLSAFVEPGYSQAWSLTLALDQGPPVFPCSLRLSRVKSQCPLFPPYSFDTTVNLPVFVYTDVLNSECYILP